MRLSAIQTKNKPKRKTRFYKTNRKGKFVFKEGKFSEMTPFCKICGNKRKHHHWLCDDCWNDKYIKNGKFQGP